ncbi:hypothetical protein [Euzebya sp.]|uniref:hypothetical protein n=1 Tax=Euzebya sp. TaxID=1971409 RepID=UPI0035144549
MATPQRFEGSSIEAVLAEVRTVLGSDAEIVEANKIRSGGLGGFFAKESYEVYATPGAGRSSTDSTGAADGSAGVTGPAPTDPAPTGASASAASVSSVSASLLDLADRVSAAESGVAAEAPTRDVTPDDTSVAHRLGDLLAGRPTSAPADFEPLSTAEMPRISTEGGAFNDVLQRIAADAGPDIADAVGARLAPAPTRPAGLATSHPHIPTVDHEAIADAAAAAVAAGTADAGQVPVPAAEVPDAAHRAVEPVGGADLTDTADLAAVQTAGVLAADERTARLMSWLERGNLPRTTVMTALRGLPTMAELPDTTGVVVAVVGERAQALRLCKQLAKAVDADPDAVVLASASYRGKAVPESQRITDAEDAQRERLSWRRRATPTFVAVECGPGLRGADKEWTRTVVDTLDPHQVIGVVAASRKTEDVEVWLQQVGGVDGLALEDVEHTSTPWAVLALGVPVAYLDRVPATPETWTDALAGAIAA